MSYRDTGFLNNATDERKQIMGLSMYYQIGRYDPSNIFIVNYKNKDILHLVKLHTRNRLHKELALTKIYMYLYDIERRMEITKANKDKNKNKKLKFPVNQYDCDYYCTPHDWQQYKTVFIPDY